MDTPRTRVTGKQDRRDQAREKARIEREAERLRGRRNRVLLQGGIGAAIVAIVVVITLVIVQRNDAGMPANGHGPKNMASNGVLIVGPRMQAELTPRANANGRAEVTDRAEHEGTVNIVMFIDYQCPYCRQFESTNNEQIQTLVDAGKATLEVHPISFLDSASLGNRYSTRAANAAACVANFDPSHFFAVNSALFADQPAERTPGRSDADLHATLKRAGASSKEIRGCVSAQTFAPWIARVTDELHIGSQTKVFTGIANTASAFGGTPTVFVNGEKYTGLPTDPDAFASFIEAQTT